MNLRVLLTQKVVKIVIFSLFFSFLLHLTWTPSNTFGDQKIRRYVPYENPWKPARKQNDVEDVKMEWILISETLFD